MVDQDQQGIGGGAEAKRGGEKTGSEVSVGEVISIYAKKGCGPGRLTRGMSRTLLEGMPVGSVDAAKPNTEALDNLIIVGDTVLGLTRTRSPEGDRTSRVRLAVLPVGEAAGSLHDAQSSATLFDIDLDELRRPRANGTIKGWEVFSFGRPDIASKTGKINPTISSIHFGMTVLDDGRVKFEDNSTNGSTVLSGRDLFQSRETGGFTDADRCKIADFVKPLEDNTYKWKREFAGMRVVDPS